MLTILWSLLGKFGGGLFGLIRKHWKATLIILAIAGVAFYIWLLRSENSHLRNKNKDLFTQNTQLAATLKDQNKAIAQLNVQYYQQQKKLKVAEKKADKVAKSTQKTITKIEHTTVPVGCMKATDWFREEMIKRAQEFQSGGPQ